MSKVSEGTEHCYIKEGKMALPNQYFAGRVGSKFIISMRDSGKILGVRCEKCAKVYVPPLEYCPRCMSKLDERWVELSNTGEVKGYTVVRYYDKHLPRKAPYILALVKLEGSDTPFPHILEGIDPKDVKNGMKVRAVFAKETTNTILDLDHFEPA